MNGVEAERVEATGAKGIFLCLSCIQLDLVLMLMREGSVGMSVRVIVENIEEVTG